MISSRASRPASLWARSITTVAEPPPAQRQRPDVHPPRVVLRRVEVRGARRPPAPAMKPSASVAEATASVFSTLTRLRPARVIGTSTTGDDRQRVPAVLEHGHPAVQHRGHPAAAVQHHPPDGESGSRLNTQTRALVPSRMAKVRGSSAFSTHTPGRLGDLGDHRLDLGQLVQGVDAAQAEMVGADVGHHRHVVVGDPDAAAQDAAAGRLGDRQLHPGQREHLAGPARPGVVAGLDQLAVEVDPVGARPADRPAGPLGDVGRSSARWWSCRWFR